MKRNRVFFSADGDGNIDLMILGSGGTEESRYYKISVDDAVAAGETLLNAVTDSYRHARKNNQVHSARPA